MHERFLLHRTIFPHDFLADFGFRRPRAGPRRARAARARRPRAGAVEGRAEHEGTCAVAVLKEALPSPRLADLAPVGAA